MTCNNFFQPLFHFFNYHPQHFSPLFCFQEMLAILKSIYDMMGRYTYPCVRDEAPYEHVDKFFQVINAHRLNKKQQQITFYLGIFIIVCVCLIASRKWTKTETAL